MVFWLSLPSPSALRYTMNLKNKLKEHINSISIILVSIVSLIAIIQFALTLVKPNYIPDHIVQTKYDDSMNLRRRPLSKDELKDNEVLRINLMAELENGHNVELLEENDNWFKVKTKINGKPETGYIARFHGEFPLKKIPKK